MSEKNLRKHSHLTLAQRNVIEKGLLNGNSFTTIATEIGKSPSTISKEIRRHARNSERKSKGFSPIPCGIRKHCLRSNLCDKLCGSLCKFCNKLKLRCSDFCHDYSPVECEKLLKPPYVCNGCAKRTGCLMQMKIYSSKFADDCYREQLVSCREGINQTPDRIMAMDALVSPLIQKGQSIAHIYSHHAEEIGCSRRTLYNYIDDCVLTARNIDLRRRVKYKKRCSTTHSSTKDRSYRQGRNYEAFQEVLKVVPAYPIVEMDTVEGRKGGKCLFTLFFRSCSYMLIFLLESQTQAEVKRVFDELTVQLGLELFHYLFPVILTDGGSEFQNPASLEYADDRYEQLRCNIYFCDPYSSWQKGAIEKNHEYIRYVLPKGSSFEHLTQAEVTLLMNHINSEARDSLNGCTPYKLSRLLLDNELHEKLGLTLIEPDEVTLKPVLIN